MVRYANAGTSKAVAPLSSPREAPGHPRCPKLLEKGPDDAIHPRLPLPQPVIATGQLCRPDWRNGDDQMTKASSWRRLRCYTTSGSRQW